MIKNNLATAIVALPLVFGGAASAQTTAKKPNIVVIRADDVVIWNISAYHRGMMGGSTLTSTASPERARSSPTTMPSNPAPPAGPRLSAARLLSVPVC
jgi:hypothetical protein